jgi:hypothetical protein
VKNKSSVYEKEEGRKVPSLSSISLSLLYLKGGYHFCEKEVFFLYAARKLKEYDKDVCHIGYVSLTMNVKVSKYRTLAN